MKKHILFIQGAGEGAFREDQKLADSLQHLLGKSYDVRFPRMENENDAPYDRWIKQITEELSTMPGNIILVGHSVGASVLINSLPKQSWKKLLQACFSLLRHTGVMAAGPMMVMKR